MAASLRNGRLVSQAATGVAREVRNHFADLNQTRPNKMGFPRTNFWADVSHSVHVPKPQSPDVATVSITHYGIRQRVEGGKIVPQHGEFLTIPANKKAYGYRAREFHNLHFGFAENPKFPGSLSPALIENNAQRVKFGRVRKDGSRKVTPGEEVGGEVFYWLVRQVYQAPDPGALPTAERMQAAAEADVREYVTLLEHQAENARQSPPKPQ